MSPNRAFSQEVPRRALGNPLLYYSCLAYAAHVLYLQGHGDHASADHYHNRAIGILIPLLDPGSIISAADKDLLAAIAILRMSEQFLEPDEDAQTHIYGAFSLLTSSTIKWLPERVDLLGIAFWVFVRQTLRICFLHEQPCPFNLDIISSDNMSSPASDEVWTNRMTLLLAKVCNACWFLSLEDTNFQQQELDTLEADIDCWHRSLPETFKPWYYRLVPSAAFPRVNYLTTWHGKFTFLVVNEIFCAEANCFHIVIAWQQYYTSKTMIAVYRQRQKTPNAYHESNQYWNVRIFHFIVHLMQVNTADTDLVTQSKILVPARLACAVILSDNDIGTGINGGHLAYWCGQFLMGRAEQYEVLSWLENFTNRTKWPNRRCIERLQKQWVLLPEKDFGGNSPPHV